MIEVLSAVSEAYPLIKTGGLADVGGALPAAVAQYGIAMRTLVPGYPAVLGKLHEAKVVAELPDLFGGKGQVLAGRGGGLDLLVVDAPHLFDRPGNPYVGPDGQDWPDNWRRFAAFSWVAAQIGHGLVENYRPQVLHAHDWQAGLVPAYAKFGPSSSLKTVFTVHNLAFQGSFGSEIFSQLRLPPEAFTMHGVEYHGAVGFLKAGLECAHYVTTVSPSYAAEIRTSAFGMGLDGLLNNRAGTVFGILNGIDMEAWDPSGDPALPKTYTAATINNRRINKTALAKRFGLENAEGPLFSVVSRLTWQKGMDLLVDTVDELVALGGKLVVLGSGEQGIENGLRSAAHRHPGRVGFITGYDENLSHLVQGGADVMLVPSRFEPCGLTQLYALRYGCMPVVSRVGGLADTIIDANEAALQAGVATGLQFGADDAHALVDAYRRTITLYRDDKTWKKMQRRGMKSDVSWGNSAARYAHLYASLTGQITDDNARD